MEERRSIGREPTKIRAKVRDGERVLDGTIVNVSSDGALVQVQAGLFAPADIGRRIELETDTAMGGGDRNQGKLVRLFDMDGRLYIALRFLDYMQE